MNSAKTGDTGQSRPTAPLAELGRLTGELVHDLNNEVMCLHGWALLARGELEAGRMAAAEIHRVLEISSHLGQMLRDMLGAVSEEALSPEVAFDPLALTEQTIAHRVRELSGLTVQLSVSLPGEVRIAGRASFWSRALTNLLSNAARHARHQIAVTLRLAESPGAAGEVVLRVEDDGEGLEPGARDTAFRPLWRGANGETGLGLSSVAWLAARLGGRVSYRDDSSLGGAAFELHAPLATPLPGSRQCPADAEAPEIAGTRLLLVDDDPTVRHALTRLLQRAGAEVRELDPGGEPDELLHSILRTLPDVILLDLRLNGCDGVSLWSRLGAEVPHLARRVAFVSGAAPGDPDWERAGQTGQPVLAKPFSLAQLRRVIAQLSARS